MRSLLLPALGIGSLLLALASSACFSNEPDSYPSPDTTTSTTSSDGGVPKPVINEQKTHATTYTDAPQQVEVVKEFRTIAELPDLDVRSLALLGTDLYAGTASGVARLAVGGSAFTALTLT